MIKGLTAAVLCGGLLATSGCARNVVSAHQTVSSRPIYGDGGISGHNNTLVVEGGSRIRKLSILGDNNNVTVEDDVRIMRIEIWGTGNTISVPNDLTFSSAEVGKDNKVIRRAPHFMEPGSEMPAATTMTPPPPVRTTPIRTENATPSDTGNDGEVGGMDDVSNSDGSW